MLAAQAHTNLVAISGRDYGKNAPAWSAWLAEAGESLPQVPLTEDLDNIYENKILVLEA